MSLNPSQPGDGPRVRITEITADRVPDTFAESSCVVPVGAYIVPYLSLSADIPTVVLVSVWNAGTMDFKPPTATSATGVNFSWYKDGVILDTGTPWLPNATGVLGIVGASSGDSGLYRCVFNGRCGTAFVEYNLVIP